MENSFYCKDLNGVKKITKVDVGCLKKRASREE